ncbi:zinc finger and BTB domain-containing protein 24 [Hydra vulgaris]|uniref:Zinc finger and BTB domain-containing protein 24 n=1 Tax=Hydra vulgaris TaxID=6087 RepID=A0ABM4DH50_HYDVU
MESLRNVSIHFDSTLPQIQNGDSLGDHVEEMDEVKPIMNEDQHKKNHKLDRQFNSLPNLVYSQNNQQKQKHLLSVSEQSYSIQQGNSHIYSPHWSRSLEQSDQQYVHSESYLSSGQNYTSNGGFQYTSATFGGHAGMFDFSKLVSTATPSINNYDSTSNDISVSHLQNSDQLEQHYVSENDEITAEDKRDQEEVIDENDLSGEDEDVHQCGRCKQIFQKLQDYISHKASKVCKPSNSSKSVLHNSIILENQNILLAAAKNTIFRDSFMSLESEQKDDTQIKENEQLPVQETSKFDQTIQVKKRGRGRPPGKSYLHFETNKDKITAVDSMQEMEEGGSMPPKAKRKSRPPRRHNPDPSPHSSNLTQQESVMLSTIDDVSGLPTVENIHKFFSLSKGRGRGRGRSRHPLHRCPICQLLFPSRTTMMEHRRKHTKLFKCKICNEGFYTEDKLERHSTKETHSYPCDQCERLFTNKAALVRHKLLHSDKEQKCELCAKSFKTPRDLKNHMLGMHSATQDFLCEVCGKGFSRREKLKRHLMIHAPDRPIFPCPFKNHVGCEKTFYRKDKLTRHLYSHSKVKPFKCEQCDKSFARTDNLREHIRSHTGVFRYYCTVCGKGQPGPKKFIQHMYKQHNVENPEIPKPFEELAPEPLIQQHKAVVEAETAARLARAASNLKKEREKDQHKYRKDDIDSQDCIDPSQHHITLATMSNLALQTVNGSTYLTSPNSQDGSGDQQQTRTTLETLYTINQHSGNSPQFQIARQVPESVVRQINESILRESLARESNLRESSQSVIRQLTTEETNHLQETLDRQLESTQLNSESLRRQIDAAQHQQDLPHGITVEAEGNIPVSNRGLQLFTQGVLPGNLQFTTLLNSDLVAIGDTVIRSQNGMPIFQQRYGPTQ